MHTSPYLGGWKPATHAHQATNHIHMCSYIVVSKRSAVNNLQKHAVQLAASGGREAVTSGMAGEEILNKVRLSL